MSTPEKPPLPNWWPAGAEVAGPSVNIAATTSLLVSFLSDAAIIHLRLFNKPLVVTSGNDGAHAPGSKHFTNKAMDLRVADKTASERLAFLNICWLLSLKYHLAVFDESMLDAGPHIHVETAG
jgi:hypothetical protein